MSNRLRNAFFVAVALLVLLGAAPACRPSHEMPTPPAGVEDVVIQEEPDSVQDVTIEAEAVSAETEQQAVGADVKKSPTAALKWKKIGPVTVSRGGGVRFKVGIHAAWIIIPDGRIKKSSGGKDWAKGKSFIAFKVENGEAVVMVPKDYPGSTTPVEIHYSVLARNAGGEWEYVHGENPPPRIIIP